MTPLTEEQCLLLAAAVDGELSPDETVEVEQLMATNPDAQEFFDLLKFDSSTLQTLPTVAMPDALRHQVLQQLTTVPLPNTPRRLPRWFGASVAVVLFCGVVLASVLAFRHLTLPTATGSVATSQPAHAKMSEKPITTDTPVSQPSQGVNPSRPSSWLPTVLPHPEPLKPVPNWQATEFDVKVQQDRFLDEYKKHTATWIDLFAADPLACCQRFGADIPGGEEVLVADASTVKRFRQPTGSTFAILLENHSADEVVALLQAQRRADQAAWVTCEQREWTQDEQAMLVTATGVAIRQQHMQKPDQPLTDATLAEIKKAFEPKRNAALLFTLEPANALPNKTNQEVMQYLQRRGPQKPTTQPTLLVFRPLPK